MRERSVSAGTKSGMTDDERGERRNGSSEADGGLRVPVVVKGFEELWQVATIEERRWITKLVHSWGQW